MTKRLLIDASHAEETRVVVLDGNRLEDFDVETLSRRQLKGNIYLAKIVRVEPSLQSAFVEYGGNRHGFLAFGEIHPDYYQIPVADRQRLIEMQEEDARAQELAEDEELSAIDGGEIPVPAQNVEEYAAGDAVDGGAATQPLLVAGDTVPGSELAEQRRDFHDSASAPHDTEVHPPGHTGSGEHLEADQRPSFVRSDPSLCLATTTADATPLIETAKEGVPSVWGHDREHPQLDHQGDVSQIGEGVSATPETIGGDAEAIEDSRTPRQVSRFMRSYKIQEVIRRRQILLVQVVKEERGTKGAALTTYISLAGRYCVLMPNSPRGGGISRKITSIVDRRRLKEVTAELDIPRGMGLIVRTAGAARPKPEIKRDGEYLLRLWDEIREQTMRSIAPSLIHEEASLIKRAIRDVYSRDVDELLVDGEDGWRAARDYMRMLMPTHVKKVQLWPSGAQPLFAHSQVESMLDSMLNPTVQLRSGGYLVINQTEALVAIDVNSGRSTRERGIEETALRTNIEAADEAARQLRLRDLAGLVVIDFIDMESKKHISMVERRMADALKNDRARIQIGHISHFGLLELSRQRLRPSLAETSLNVCAACGGSGHVRSTESAALHVLREIEEEGGRRRAAEIIVHVAGDTALYILNNKRQRLTEIEARYGMKVCFAADNSLLAAQTRIEKLRAAVPQDLPVLPPPQARPMPDDDAAEADIGDDEDDVIMSQTRVEAGASASPAEAGDYTTDTDHVPGETAAEGEQRRKRRRRRRRGGRREDTQAPETAAPFDGAEQPDISDMQTFGHAPGQPELLGSQISIDNTPAHKTDFGSVGASDGVEPPGPFSADASPEEGRPKRGRRGGRRRRKPEEEGDVQAAPEALAFPAYVGPTPADPFALSGLDIFDALEQAESRPNDVVVAEAPQPLVEASVPVQPTEGYTAEATSLLGKTRGNAAQAKPTIESDPAGKPGAEQAEEKPATLGPIVGPTTRPVLIGAAEIPAAALRKGWWRR